jgi:hypothetical protein
VLHFRRYIAALSLLLVAFGLYYLAVPPWLAPPSVTRIAVAGQRAPVQQSAGVESELARLFAADAWERDPKTKVVETSQCILLVRDYLPTADGRLELKPCTVVFYAGGESGEPSGNAPAPGSRRPIILQAPAGAVLHFDKPLEIGKGDFGQITGGHLAGEITIYSPPTSPTSDDGLRLVTREVQLSRERILAPYEVEFAYGKSSGRGSDLAIDLVQDKLAQDKRGAPGQNSTSFQGVRSLTIGHIELLRIAMPVSKAGTRTAALPLAGGAGLPKDGGPLEVTCQGPFVFDFQQQVAMLEDRVEILRLVPGSAPDRLRCDKLLMEFAAKQQETRVARGETLPTLDSPQQRPVAGKLNSSAGDSLEVQDAVAGRLQRVIAFGRPAVLESPTSAARAVACRMEYSLTQRRIVLVPGREAPQVTLRQASNEFTARELEYEFANQGQIGRLWAAGPGSLTAARDEGPSAQVITARWQKELRIRPQAPNQVISLTGGAVVGIDSHGQFSGDELHVWILETERGSKKAIVPDRLLATGTVRIESPQLHAETARLEAWFITGPQEEAASPPADRPLAPFPSPLAPDSLQQASAQQFKVTGDLVQIRLLMRGKQVDLEDLTIRGAAQIDEIRTPEPGQEPIHIKGDLVTLRGGSTPQAKVEVAGHPAELGGRGIGFIGSVLNVSRGENRAWIDGPGEATLPLPDGNSLAAIPLADAAAPVREPGNARPPGPPKKMHVVWHDGLDFDGQTIRLNGEVEARTATQLVMCPTLEITLSQPLDLANLRGKQPLELGRLHLNGGVYVENHGVDEFGQPLSHDQFKAKNLTIDRLAGRLNADGPGWVSSVRRGIGNLPGAPAGIGSPPPAPGSALPAEAALSSIHIQFEHRIEGRLDQRTIEFQRKIRTTYSPARDFDDLIVARTPEDLGEQGVLMTSEKLAVTAMQVGGQKWLEMEAKENAIVEGRTFTVRAASVRYTSDKEVLTIEGNGRTDAEIWYQSVPGQPRTYTSARKLRYWIREGEFDGEDFNILDLQQLSPRLKLPGRRR